jgi:outer membrane receptor protein involved in Fe transport
MPSFLGTVARWSSTFIRTLDARGFSRGRPRRAGFAATLPSCVRGIRDTVTVLPPVQVDANRTAPSTRTTATSVRVDHAAVHRFLPASTTDALIVVPGIDLVRTGPWASRIAFRGFTGERVLVMVDGVRLNSGRGHGALSSLVSLDRLDQIELSPGAASAQYGSDAMGGVVNLVTHRDLVGLARRATLSIGVLGATPGGEQSQSARLRVTGRNLGFEVWTGFARTDELVTPDGPVENSSSSERDLTGRVSARLGFTTLDYEHSHHQADNVGLPAFNGVGGGSGDYPLQGRDADRLELIAHPAGSMRDARARLRPDVPLRLHGADRRGHLHSQPTRRGHHDERCRPAGHARAQRGAFVADGRGEARPPRRGTPARDYRRAPDDGRDHPERVGRHDVVR